ncbi:hypothetical protein [Mesorhizobium sp. M4B.F.Ca.ET.017.02.2.1]|uniref:hypothetical protein n=1 Tax=Mesorhizobium sp. M4B.F.Ca.ET.017.02.2.1 TaxID=2496649 RepID=UPI000FCAB51E|nr:hypothetical protein [Mesorhizobium sp. M4B.F.Ca.ET.017.02.2.1]RVD20235.1 hypothetical protein EN738_23445 [Mesorhizobium sp. M4B.F.Ca.ET.017.02.2.1]
MASPPAASGVAYSNSETNVTSSPSRLNLHDEAGRPANDNHTAPRVFSILDLISTDDDEVANRIRRAERFAIAVLIAMAVCLIAGPIVYATLMFGI